MIDVSDGLVQDLGHLCRASGVAAEIDVARLPVARGVPSRRSARPRRRFAATAGEDYELLLAVPALARAPARAPRAAARVPA